jgi:colanic acid/amylovoran biosynthesis glycosyltransferase
MNLAAPDPAPNPAKDQLTARGVQAGAGAARLCIAYLVNQYPKISHKFIRREIAGLEDCGVRVERFSLRLSGENFADEDDRSELQKTRVVLQAGPFRLALACAAAVFTRPVRFARALWLALRVGADSDRGVLAHMAYLAEACVLLGWLARQRVDHVHAHFGANPAAVAMLCHVLGGPPYSVTIHGPNDFDRARFLGLNEKIARARFVMTVSSYGRSQLYRWCGPEHWSKIHVLHPGVDAGFLNRPPAPIPAAPRLVCVGRLDGQKGQLLLIDAVGRLIDAGVRCELVLVGDGPLRTQIQTRIAELHLEEYVVLAGAVTTAELCARMQAARALVLASLAENLPSVILEAFALHRPVIATFIGGIPEVVDPGVNGWLVPAGSVEGIERAMREALEASVDTLERMGAAGARRAIEQFRSDDAARQLLRRFQPAAENGRPL